MNLSGMTWSKVGCLIVAGMGLILQYIPQVNDLLNILSLPPATKSTIGFTIALIGGICTSVLSTIHSHQLEQLQSAIPVQPVGNPSNGPTTVKTGLFLIGFLILASGAMAQSVLVYGGGLNFTAQALTAPEHGIFLSPLAQFSYEPVVFQNGQVTLEQNFTGNFAYAFSAGTIMPDPNVKGAIDIKPDAVVDVFVGDGFLQQAGPNSIYINQGLFGVGFGKPSILGDLMLSVGFPMSGGGPQLGLSFTNSFDVLNGLGVIKL